MLKNRNIFGMIEKKGKSLDFPERNAQG